MAAPPDRPAVPAGDSPAGASAEIVPLAAPIVQAPWSADFMAQTLEVFPLCLGPDGLIHLRPIHAASLRLPLGIGGDPAGLVLTAVARYELTPIVVHSTSWRSEPDRVILSYVAAVEPPRAPNPFLAADPVGRAGLARGERTAAPVSIDVLQVLEHALRHLAWLVREDPAVRDALGSWRPWLEPYVPEPFRSL
jgi:hypothetical protein